MEIHVVKIVEFYQNISHIQNPNLDFTVEIFIANELCRYYKCIKFLTSLQLYFCTVP